MPRPAYSGRRCALGALALGLAVTTAGCADADHPGALGADPSPTTLACAGLVPDAFYRTLGWTAPTPTPDSVSCDYQSPQGAVSIHHSGGFGEGDAADRADREFYDRSCATVRKASTAARPYVADPAWQPAGAHVCLTELDADQRVGPVGMSLLTGSGDVVSIRIGVLQPVDDAAFERALGALTQTLDEQL